MNYIVDINGFKITEKEIMKISYEVIEILAQKNITHAVAYMILDRTKEELQNTIVKKSN